MYNKQNNVRWISQYIFEQLNVDVLWPDVAYPVRGKRNHLVEDATFADFEIQIVVQKGYS